MNCISKYSFYTWIALSFICTSGLFAQVQVSEEPLHRKVIENKYIRLLDVWMEPGDTSLFHKHSTPSLFTQFTNTALHVQIKGQAWTEDESKAGNVYYKSFSPDALVHRVSNADTLIFHVVDVELLSRYDRDQSIPDYAMPLTLLFENDRAYAYQISDLSQVDKTIMGRGPVIAELISGGPLVFYNELVNETDNIKAGQFKYIEPNAWFHFTSENKDNLNLVMLELK